MTIFFGFQDIVFLYVSSMITKVDSKLHKNGIGITKEANKENKKESFVYICTFNSRLKNTHNAGITENKTCIQKNIYSLFDLHIVSLPFFRL